MEQNQTSENYAKTRSKVSTPANMDWVEQVANVTVKQRKSGLNPGDLAEKKPQLAVAAVDTPTTAAPNTPVDTKANAPSSGVEIGLSGVTSIVQFAGSSLPCPGPTITASNPSGVGKVPPSSQLAAGSIHPGPCSPLHAVAITTVSTTTATTTSPNAQSSTPDDLSRILSKDGPGSRLWGVPRPNVPKILKQEDGSKGRVDTVTDVEAWSHHVHEISHEYSFSALTANSIKTPYPGAPSGGAIN